MVDEDTEGTSLLDLGSDSVSREDLDDTRQKDPDAFTDKYRESVALDQVRGAVRQYGEDGISVSMIADLLEMSNETVRKHLETLCSLREVYKQKKNKQMYLYYPNGKPLHGLGTRRIESDDGDTIIEMQLAQGRREQLFVHVTEKRFSLLEGERTEGAVMFPLNKLDEFFAELDDLADEVDQE
ncbi:hypothetical protein [Halobellus captivus]|uniref:hypothetical protein n=1 Tax=Halobellus captivus TaxID=2592614 RepID=UPI0011A2D8D5|nr:hypothetical protein [Halobellus captivus]